MNSKVLLILLYLLKIYVTIISCNVLPINESVVDLPQDFLPKKEAFGFPNQIIILYVPTNGLGINNGFSNG
jgi:hypothetical protein